MWTGTICTYAPSGARGVFSSRRHVLRDNLIPVCFTMLKRLPRANSPRNHCTNDLQLPVNGCDLHQIASWQGHSSTVNPFHFSFPFTNTHDFMCTALVIWIIGSVFPLENLTGRLAMDWTQRILLFLSVDLDNIKLLLLRIVTNSLIAQTYQSSVAYFAANSTLKARVKILSPFESTIFSLTI